MNNKITIYDIAKLAGVSTASVSRAIHQPDFVKDGTRQKIWTAFKEAGISPSELSFKKVSPLKRTAPYIPTVPTILVCLPSGDNLFYYDTVEGIRTYLKPVGYETVVYTVQLNKYHMQKFLEFAASLQVTGIIVMTQLSEDILYELNAHYPLVQCGEYNPLCSNLSYVSVDDYSQSEEAVAYLVNSGSRKPGFFSAPYKNRYVQNRFRAFKNVLTNAGMVIEPEYLIQVNDDPYDRILSAANRFFLLPEPPDSIFATSGRFAHAVIKAALQNGINIPKELKVIGFDNTMFSILSMPTITTIHIPRRELGVESAKILLEKILHPDTSEKHLLLPSYIVWKEST